MIPLPPNAPRGRAARESDRDSRALCAQRHALVDVIAANGVRDPVTLAAMRAVPRHEFVPPEFAAGAYADRALPIGPEQTISQPTIVAIMTEAIRPRPGLRVLEVGTGSGYQAAVLAQAGCRVHTIEYVASLAESARARLHRLGYAAVEVRHNDGFAGWPDAAPFDAILIAAAPEQVPAPLLEQLAPLGRLIAPLGLRPEAQQLLLFEKDARGNVHSTTMQGVRFVPMRGETERREGD